MTNFNYRIQFEFYPMVVITSLLTLAYSPYYIYNYLITKFMDGGDIRAMLGLSSACLFFVYIFLRAYGKKIKYPKNTYLFILSFLYLLFVALFSIYLDRDIYYIVYELYPLVEGFLFFMIGYYLVAIGLKKEMIASLLFFCVVNSFFDLFITLYYYMHNLNFAYTVDVGGILVNRIPDSMLPIYLAVGLVMLKYYNYGPLKIVTRLLVIVSLILLLISFWRTLMISGFVVLLVYIFKHRNHLTIKKSILYIFSILLALLIVSRIVETNMDISIESAISERVSSAFDENKSQSLGNRIEDNKVVLLQILKNPIVGHGFGSLYGDLSGSQYYLADTSNFLLRIPAHFGLLVTSIIFSGFYFFYRNIRRFSRYIVLKDDAETVFSLALLQSLNYVFLAVVIILIAFPSVLHYPLLAILCMLIGAIVRDKASYNNQ
jgi:O-antigen ligase